MKNHFGFLTLFLAFGLAQSCNKTVAPLNDTNLNPGSGTLDVTKIYPHSEEFKKTRLHGTSFLLDGSTCAKCHGSNYLGGTSKVSCTQCHKNYPHTSEWSLPANHGEQFVKLGAEDRQKCFTCHDSGLNEPALRIESLNKVSCTTCHMAYPHVPEFEMGNIHKPFAAKTLGNCLSCHGETGTRNMPNFEAGCMDCHGDEIEPHFIWRPIKKPPPPSPDPSGDLQDVQPGKSESTPINESAIQLSSKRKPAGKSAQKKKKRASH